MKNIPTIPLKDFIEDLKTRSNGDLENYEVSFSGLTYNRVVLRSDNTIQVEFEESVYIDDKNKVHIDN